MHVSPFIYTAPARTAAPSCRITNNRFEESVVAVSITGVFTGEGHTHVHGIELARGMVGPPAGKVDAGKVDADEASAKARCSLLAAACWTTCHPPKLYEELTWLCTDSL